jgi:hypothetical protein
LALLALTALSVSAQEHQQPLTLMRFSYVEAMQAGKPKYAEVNVPAVPGASPSPLRDKPLATIAILPGSAIRSSVPPIDVVVDLYQGTAAIGGNLLCSIRIRYAPDADGVYQPRYQIHQEPVVFRGPGGRWIPVEAVCATPALVKFRAPKPADTDGFYPMFEFGFTDRPLQIDSWIVR